MLSITDLPFVQKARRKLARHGLWNSLQQALFRLLEATVRLRILRGLHLDRTDPEYLACEKRYTPDEEGGVAPV